MASNCVLLTVDSLRADHVNPDLMPTVNDLSDGGLACERAYATGYSTPNSFPGILTSTLANEYGGPGYMSGDRPFLARTFAQAGYGTAAFHTNPHLRRAKNYDVGFGSFNDFDDGADNLSRARYLVTQTLDGDSLLYKVLKRFYHLIRTTAGSTDYAPAPEINRRALEWLDEERDDDAPFFVWNHYMDVHYPFYPPSEFLDAEISMSRRISLNGKIHERPDTLGETDVDDLRALYRGDVRYLDHHIGGLLDALEVRGLLADTLVVLTSDHGELFGEHGLFGHPPSGYEPSLRVPLVFNGPEASAGVSITEPVWLTDIAPTVADLLGLEASPAWEGLSLRRSMEGDGLPEGRTVLVGDVETLLACQAADWRLVRWRDTECPTDPDREWELLRVPAGDPVPIDDHGPVFERLRRKIRLYEAKIADQDSLAEPDVEASTMRRLDALGYR